MKREKGQEEEGGRKRSGRKTKKEGKGEKGGA
jgi:hypothetical protein